MTTSKPQSRSSLVPRLIRPGLAYGLGLFVAFNFSYVGFAYMNGAYRAETFAELQHYLQGPYYLIAVLIFFPIWIVAIAPLKIVTVYLIRGLMLPRGRAELILYFCYGFGISLIFAYGTPMQQGYLALFTATGCALGGLLYWYAAGRPQAVTAKS